MYFRKKNENVQSSGCGPGEQADWRIGREQWEVSGREVISVAAMEIVLTRF